ncbi:Protein of unknown function (DUF3505) domain containing protein, partial [Elaphomyces granulatus]
MSTPPVLTVLEEYGLIICEPCQCVVWPKHVAKHCMNEHGEDEVQAAATAAGYDNDADLKQGHEALQLPSFVDTPVPFLPIHNGLVCRVDPDRCWYVSIAESSMRTHVKVSHRQDYKPTTATRLLQRQQAIGADTRRWRDTFCQRFITNGAKSSYFAVRSVPRGTVGRPPSAEPATPDRPTKRARTNPEARLFGEVMADADVAYDEDIRDNQAAVEGRRNDEPNPLIQWTGWDGYLNGYEWADLLALTERPDGAKEPVASAIWKATEELAFIANETVRRAADETRLQATRIRENEQRAFPLQAISDRKNVVKYARPWQAVMMFFARTQGWRSWRRRPPRYKFKDHQNQAWRRLVATMGEPESAHGSGAEGDNPRDGSDDGTDDDDDNDGSGVDDNERDDSPKHDEDDGDNEDDEDDELTEHRACMEFCISLLDQKVIQTEYDCALTCATAALGVHSDGRWRATDTYSPLLSALIKIGRFLVVQKATETVAERYDHPRNIPLPVRCPPSRRGQPEVGCPDVVRELMDRFMVRGTNGPMQRMVHLRSRCMQLNKQRTSEGRVQWDGDRVLYGNVGFDMDQLQGMIRGLIQQARRTLTEELLLLPAGGGTDGTPPPIPWSGRRKLVDDPSNENIGWNFLKDGRVSWPVDGRHWLRDHIEADDERQGQFVSTRFPINEAGIARYMKAVVKLRERLMVLVHITGGQPARGPELLSVRHTNTAGGRHRNVFIEDGYVAMATRYHKGNSATLSTRIIHRYLPREVGELLVWYLWLVLPFQRRVERLLWRGDTETGTGSTERGYIDNHLWPRDPGPEGREWKPPRLRGVVRGAFETATRQRIGVQTYRHLAIAMGRRYLHGREMFRYRETDREGDRDDPDVQAAEILDRQAAHMPDVAGRVYARLVGEQRGVIRDRREQYRLSSLAWHRLLGF